MISAEHYTFGEDEHIALSLLPCVAETPDEQHFADQDDDIVQTLDLLCPGAAVEIRVLTYPNTMLIRRFVDHTSPASFVRECDASPRTKAIYVVMNSFDASLIKGKGVDDGSVTHRLRLLIDVDAEHPADTNATDAERAHAFSIIQAIKTYLAARGWGAPLECDSGNGPHLVYPIDLPNDEQSLAIVSGVLKHLATTFDTPEAHIDTSVANASRITKLYGTMVRKGPATPGRPHRRSAITHIPEPLACVPVVALQQIADLAPKDASKQTSTGKGLYEISRVLARVEVFPPTTKRKGLTTYQIRCPWQAGHSTQPDGRDGTIFTVGDDGAVGFHCPHNHCKDRRWVDLRDYLGIETEARRLQADAFPTTETGDAEYFAALNGDSVRYDHRRGRWLLFDGNVWVTQTNGEIARLALEAIRERQRAAVGSKDRLRWALGGEARTRQNNLLALAQNIIPIADAGDSWDTDPLSAGAPNGVINLRDGSLRPGRPEDRITMRVRVPFDPDATCPLYDQTVNEIFNNDSTLIDYHDRYVGYSLTGDCREESLAFCWGDGANGKGLLMNTTGFVLGDYADDLPFSAFELHSHAGIPNDIAKIVNKRFITASETAETTRLNESRVKALTGRDPITARFLHKEFFTFQPVAKFWLAANHKPQIRDDSAGFWRRIHLIPFTQSFVGREDKTRKDRLRLEAAGILARAVRGCLAWQREGLKPPVVVTEATKTYQADSMPLARFLDECCVVEETARATFGDLFKAYVKWRGSSRDGRMGRHDFSDALHQRFKQDGKNTQRVTFTGVGLLDLFREECG